MDEPTLFLLYFMCTLIGVGLVALLVLFCMVLYHEPAARKATFQILAFASVVLAVSAALYLSHPLDPSRLWPWFCVHWSALWVGGVLTVGAFFALRTEESRENTWTAIQVIGILLGGAATFVLTLFSVIHLLLTYGIIK